MTRTGMGEADVWSMKRTTSAVAGRAVRDVLLWTVLSGAGLLWYLDRARSSLTLGLVIPLLVLAAAVPGSRRRPGVAVFLVNALCALGLASPGTPANAYLLALAVLTFLLGTRSAGTSPALPVFAGCLAVDLGLCAVLRVDAVYWFYAVTLLPLALVLPWLTGRYWKARQALVRGGWQRARSLEKQQGYVAEQARLRERARIAADMHDSLGHELSLIALRAGALELSPTLTGQDRKDLAQLRASVADAVGHLRDTIGVLRDGATAEPMVSSVESVEQLVDRVRGSGVDVDLRCEGKVPALPPLVDRAVYRVVQESLTNSIKHAPGSGIRVRLTRNGSRTEVRVVNSPSPAGRSADATPGGHGLTGLRERVLMIGGTLRAAPHEGGFEVIATLPDLVRTDRPGTAGTSGASFAENAEDTEDAHSGWDPVSESESVRRLASVRRTARWRFALAFSAPAGIGLVTALSAALLAYQLTTCVLRPLDYAALRIGAPRSSYAAVLPQQTFRYPSDRMKAQPAPEGTDCEFYRSNTNLLDQADVYRLCWSGSRLAAKDVLSGRPGGG
ncbi:sensor histidine kinase [Streptomyces sp. NPDC059970]|uniref:sensor histidine kinase n=1 Tax=Streptomyces sp. NPDC059970 TaxID=3347019 RepID=UPI0036A6CE52